MNKLIAPAACLLIFGLTATLLFPWLFPGNDKIPSDQPINGNHHFIREGWLDSLAFEVILDASMDRFGLPQLQNQYIGGGYLISGDPRDGTLSPLTWVAYFFDPLARMKFKMLLALLAGFAAVYLYVRRAFALGRAGSAGCGVFFLSIISFWPSLLEYPLDTGMLLALPAFTVFLAYSGSDKNTPFIGLFLALAFFQTGSGIFAVTVAFILAGLALGLGTKGTRKAHPIRDMLIALCFAFMFGAIKLSTMATTFTSYQAFWANPVPPTVRMSPFNGSTAIGPAVVIIVAAIIAMIGWLLLKPARKSGPVLAATFALLVLLPDWAVLTQGMLGDSSLPGPLDSPARYFFPFFAYIVALSAGAWGAWLKEEKPGVTKGLQPILLACLAVIVLTGSIRFSGVSWAPVGEPFDIPKFSPITQGSDFYQIRTYRSRLGIPPEESVHPVVMAPLNVGVLDHPMSSFGRGKRNVPGPPTVVKVHNTRVLEKVKIIHDPPTAFKTPRYRGEWQTSSSYISIEKIEEWANTIKIKVIAQTPGKVILNRNFDQSWKINMARIIRHRYPVLTISLDQAGEYDLVLKYRPFSLYFGAVVTIVSLILSVVFFRPWRRDDSEYSGEEIDLVLPEPDHSDDATDEDASADPR